MHFRRLGALRLVEEYRCKGPWRAESLYLWTRRWIFWWEGSWWKNLPIFVVLQVAISFPYFIYLVIKLNSKLLSPYWKSPCQQYQKIISKGSITNICIINRPLVSFSTWYTSSDRPFWILYSPGHLQWTPSESAKRHLVVLLLKCHESYLQIAEKWQLQDSNNGKYERFWVRWKVRETEVIEYSDH